MTPDPTIADMRRRIQRWLKQSPAGEGADDDTVERLHADITALEAELQTLFPSGESTPEAFEALREQAVLRTVLESMVEGVLVADMEGRFLIFNEAARHMLGRGPEELEISDWSDEYGLFHADGKTPFSPTGLPLARALRGESVDDEELLIRPPEALGRHASATARPLWDSDGRQIGGVVVFHDITEAKSSEQELRRARESAENTARAKSQFLANMSHEIRTPLTAVLGFADLLLDPKLSASDHLDYVQAVRRNGEHLLALINDVLDLSKINSDQVRVRQIDCSLHEVVHEVSSIMRERAYERDLGFDVAYDTPIPLRVRSDPMRVWQVLFNLLELGSCR